MDGMIKSVPNDFVVLWFIVFAALVVFLWKTVPKVVTFFNAIRSEVNHIEKIVQATEAHSEQIDRIENMLKQQQKHLDELDRIQQLQSSHMSESLEERELLIRSVLAIVQGLQEVGANGPTQKAEKEIQDYLLRKSHGTVSIFNSNSEAS